MAVAVDNQFMREINVAAVLSALRRRTTASVAELASATGLSRQAVTRSLTGLQAADLVEFLPPDPSADRRGRPAHRVRFRAEAGHVLGARIEPRAVEVQLADLSGEVVSRAQAAATDNDHVDALRACATEAMTAAGVPHDGIWHASIGTPGVVDPEAGTVHLSPSIPSLVGDGLNTALAQHFSCPVRIDNDINLAAEAERSSGAHDDTDSMVLVHWGERIGAGIVLAGELHRGTHNDAGDLGFLDLLVPEAAAEVEDDGLGAFEAWAGARAFVQLAEADLDGDLDEALLAVSAAVRRGDATAGAALTEISHRLGYGVAAIRALLDPAVVVISGPMTHLGDLVLEHLDRTLTERRLASPRLRLASTGDDAVCVGAIRHSLNEVDRSGRLPTTPTTPAPLPIGKASS